MDMTLDRKLGVVERLRSLHDAEVTITTHDGSFTGTVLSCTRLSVWLISDDEDVVLAIDEISAVSATESLAIN